MPRNGKSYGRVKVKKVKHNLEDIPEDCGYDKKFKYDIDMQSNGIMGECIEWCQKNCKNKWGWWFEAPNNYNPLHHNWEEQNSYMSFQYKRDATRFWMAIGLQNMGERSR